MRRTLLAGFLMAGCAAMQTPVGNILHAGQEPPEGRLLYFAYSMSGNPERGLRTANLYMITGDDHHTVAVDAEDQIILVDTKSVPQWGARIIRRLQNISDQQVAILINTNPHQGASNGEFPMVGEIIAHENTAKRMAGRAGGNAKALPNKTFTDKLSFPVKTIGTEDGSNRIDLFHFGPGYTDGDTVVVLPQYNTAFLGELFPGKSVPLIDRATGGSAIRMPDTLDRAVATLKTYPPLQNVIASHDVPPIVYSTSIRPVNRLQELEEYVAFTRALVDASLAAHAAKKSVDDAVAGFSVPERFKSYSLDRLRPFVQAVYDELR